MSKARSFSKYGSPTTAHSDLQQDDLPPGLRDVFGCGNS